MKDLLNLLDILKRAKPITFNDFIKAVKEGYDKAVVEEITKENKSINKVKKEGKEGCCNDK
jgi:hypothetical protein